MISCTAERCTYTQSTYHLRLRGLEDEIVERLFQRLQARLHFHPPYFNRHNRNDPSESHLTIRYETAQPCTYTPSTYHLRLRGLEDEIAELLHLHARLERQLQLRPLDHNVGEIEQMHLRKGLAQPEF